MIEKRWAIAAPSPHRLAAARRWNVSPLIAQLLLNRGASLEEPGPALLAPQLKNLHAPAELPHAEEAAALIVDAVRRKRRIVIYGDYDVDGTTAIAILWHVLHAAGAEPLFYVPHRIEEGYGLSLEACRQLSDEGAELVVTVDCGITAMEAAEELKARGVDLIVSDHHTPGPVLPAARVIVHPFACGASPNPHLSGAGVAFKLAWAVAQRLSGADRVGSELRRLLLELLPLAALGTVADVVPLTGENRILAKHGLESLRSTCLPGLRALMESAGLMGNSISSTDVGFKLAPRINAVGRMGHARLAVELFTRADRARASEIALYLEEHNRSRQAVERRISKQAVEMVDRQKLAGDSRRAIVLAGKGWHAGVIGIVAARMVDRYHRPTVLIALSENDGQGSGRSIAALHLYEALQACEEHLHSFGGHAMAAGFSVSADKVEAFAEAFVAVANQRLTAADLTPTLQLDGEATLDEFSLDSTQAMLALGPFGIGNPRPRFATDFLELAAEPRCVGSRLEHLQVSLRQGAKCAKGIGFGMADRAEDLKHHRRCRVAFEPIINEFNGRRDVELQILDFKFPA